MSEKQKEKFRRDVTNKFLRMIDQDPLHWTRGWQTVGMDTPRNGGTGHAYSGINWFSLSLSQIINKYTDPRWVTMHQIIDPDNTVHPNEKWHLKKGSHGETVEFWFPFDKSNKKSITWNQYRNEIINEGRADREFSIYPKYFYVFNASMVEGIPNLAKNLSLHPEIQPDELIEKLSESMQVPIYYDGGDRAYYSPSQDEIHLPRPDRFNSQGELALTTLHELGHSTGNNKRLSRDQSGFFGTEQYAMEELVAELTSVFMSKDLQNISTDISCYNNYENNIAYVQSWIKAIKEKPEALIKAVKDAAHASDYMEFKAGIMRQQEYEKKYGCDDIGLQSEEKKQLTFSSDHEKENISIEKDSSYKRSEIRRCRRR